MLAKGKCLVNCEWKKEHTDKGGEIDNLINQLKDKEQLIDKIQQDIKNKKEDGETYMEQFLEERKNYSFLKRAFDKLNLSNKKIEKEKEILVKDNDQLNQEINKIETEYVLNDKWQKLVKDVDSMKKTSNYYDAEVKRLEQRSEELKTTLKQDIEEINQLREEHNSKVKSIKILESDVKKLNNQKEIKPKIKLNPFSFIQRFIAFRNNLFRIIKERFKR